MCALAKGFYLTGKAFSITPAVTIKLFMRLCHIERSRDALGIEILNL